MKRNKVLKFVLSCLAMGLLLAAPHVGLATPITFDATLGYTNNTARVTINPIVTRGAVYTEYSLHAAGIGTLDAFCVENVWASRALQQYELRPLGEELYRAAWLAEQFWNGSVLGSKEDYQIAIWELVFDGGNTDLGAGNFQYHGGANPGNIADILDLVPIDAAPTAGVYLAYNSEYQNFLVRYPVSEPSTLLLLGAALLGLAGVGKKRWVRL